MNRLIFYGESIGTGVAVQMATEYQPAALVLQSPYTSVEQLAVDQYPWLPVRWLIRDRFDSLSKIESVHAPILFFHGDIDPVVPIYYGRELFAKAHEPKEAVYYPGFGHVDLDIGQLTQAVIEFSARQKLLTPALSQ